VSREGRETPHETVHCPPSRAPSLRPLWYAAPGVAQPERPARDCARRRRRLGRQHDRRCRRHRLQRRSRCVDTLHFM